MKPWRFKIILCFCMWSLRMVHYTFVNVSISKRRCLDIVCVWGFLCSLSYAFNWFSIFVVSQVWLRHHHWLVGHLSAAFLPFWLLLLLCALESVMDLHAGSLQSIKTRRCLECMAQLDERIRKQKAANEALASGSTAVRVYVDPRGRVMFDGVGLKPVETGFIGQKQERSGRKQERSGRKQIRIRTQRKTKNITCS